MPAYTDELFDDPAATFVYEPEYDDGTGTFKASAPIAMNNPDGAKAPTSTAHGTIISFDTKNIDCPKGVVELRDGTRLEFGIGQLPPGVTGFGAVGTEVSCTVARDWITNEPMLATMTRADRVKKTTIAKFLGEQAAKLVGAVVRKPQAAK